MATNTKTTNLLYTRGASIDANYGPWPSFDAYRNFLISCGGNGTPKKGVHVAIEDTTTGTITTYIYEVKNSVGSWKAEGGTVDLTEINNRLDALEADKNAAIADKITSSISVTPARFYKGVSTNVSATGTISLPSGISASKISSISITDGNGHTDSGDNKTSVSLSNISAENSTITFNLSASIAAPFTKTITEPGYCTVCNPVYLAVVSNSVDTKEEAFTEVAKAANLVYTSSLAVTSMKGLSKSLTFTNGDRIAVICGDSGLKAKGAGMLADYNWVVNGESVTDNGITYKVYVSGALQAETRTINFS